MGGESSLLTRAVQELEVRTVRSVLKHFGRSLLDSMWFPYYITVVGIGCLCLVICAADTVVSW